MATTAEFMAKADEVFGSDPVKAPPQHNNDGAYLDLPAYLDHHGIAYKTKPNGTKVIYCLEHCLFDPSHTDNDAAFFQGNDGKLGYKCFHDSCSGFGWKDARRHLSGDDSLRDFMVGLDTITPDDFDSMGKESPEWPEPEILTKSVPSAPKFPTGILPTDVRLYVKDHVERLQCPADMVAVPAIVELAGLIGKEATMRPKERDSEWSERGCLWSIVISPKSTMKSAAIKAGIKNLQRIQARYHDDDAKIKSEYLAKLEVFNLRITAFKKIRQDKLKKDPTAELPEIPEELKDPPKRPIPRRKIVNDPTCEKLADLMVESPGLTLVRDEISSFMLNMNRYHSGSDRQFFLECYSGGSHSVDRIARGEQYIKDLYLNIVGGIQPSVAREIFSIDENSNDGFFERFGLCAYPERKQNWKLVDRYPNNDARELMSNLCDRLSSTNWEKVLSRDTASDGEEYGKPYVSFDDHAQMVFDGWLTRHMNDLSKLDDDDPMAGFIGKRRGLLVRLCLVFHLAKWAAKETSNIKYVSDKTLNDVLILMDDYISPMQERIMVAFSMTKTDQGMQKVTQWIEDGRIKEFTLREIRRKQWSGLKTDKEITPIIDNLIAMNWLRKTTKKSGPKGGRSYQAYQVNPGVVF